MLKKEFLKHNGFNFEIRINTIDDKYCVKVFIDDFQVSPLYSVDIEYEKEYFKQHEDSLVKQLVEMAKRDIENDIFFGGCQKDESK
jgi:hypothetical protein